MPRNRLYVGAAVAVVAVAALAFGGWYAFIPGDEPPPVSLAEAVASLGDVTPTGEATPVEGSSNVASTAETATETASATTEVTAAAETGDLSGTWSVVPAESIVGYRIQEELANVGSTTAVGRTSDVEGTLTFDGQTITAVEVMADLRTLQSDDNRRDRQLRQQALESDEYPEARFVLVEPITVEGDPASGDVIAAMAVGDLTMHGVTNRVELALEGQLVGEQVAVVGSTVILLADYGIAQPESMMVLSVSEEATMEMSLVFERV